MIHCVWIDFIICFLHHHIYSFSYPVPVWFYLSKSYSLLYSFWYNYIILYYIILTKNPEREIRLNIMKIQNEKTKTFSECDLLIGFSPFVLFWLGIWNSWMSKIADVDFHYVEKLTMMWNEKRKKLSTIWLTWVRHFIQHWTMQFLIFFIVASTYLYNSNWNHKWILPWAFFSSHLLNKE